MRMLRPLLLLLACSVVPSVISAQETSSPPPAEPGPQTAQAATILQQSLAALTGGSPVTDVTMTGTIAVTIGSSTQSGTIGMVATNMEQGRVLVNLPSGTQTEIRAVTSGGATLTEIGGDGVPHVVHTQSAMAPPPAWFCPELVVASGATSPEYSSSYIGDESLNGTTVHHMVLWLANGSPLGALPGSDVPGRHDLYLDSSSMLPVRMTFTAHPYDPSSPDRQLHPDKTSRFDNLEEIWFSDYRSVQGRLVPFHIRTYLHLPDVTPIADIEVSSASFNTGATITAN